MFNLYKDKTLKGKVRTLKGTKGGFERRFLVPVMCLPLLGGSLPVAAQDQQGQAPASGTQSQTPDSGKPKQEVPAEAGGPTDNIGPYAIPKKKAEEAPPPPPPVTPKKIDDLPDYSLKVNVPLVNVDVLVSPLRKVYVRHFLPSYSTPDASTRTASR